MSSKQLMQDSGLRGALCAAIFVSLCGLMLACPGAARAEFFHFKQDPQFTPEQAAVIADPSLAQRFFSRLEKCDDADYFSFTAEQGKEYDFYLDVPHGDPDLHPTLTLFGPGLPQPDEDPVILIGDQNGAIVAHEDKNGRTSNFDRATFTDFFLGPSIKFTAPKDATYGLAVRTPNGHAGRYVLRLAGKDEFSWTDLVTRLAAEIKALLRRY